MKSNLAVAQEPEDIEQTLQQEVKSVALIQVVDPETYAQAGDRCKAIVAIEKKVGEYWDPLCDSAHKTWKGLVAKRSEFLDPLATAKKTQNAGMVAWKKEADRKRLEEERLAQEAARKKAEDEALAEAAALEKAGNKAEAEKVIQAPVVVPQVVVQTSVPAGYGNYGRETWKAEVSDIKALARAVLAGQIPEQALMGNSVFIGQQVRSLKGGMKWPGIRAWSE